MTLASFMQPAPRSNQSSKQGKTIVGEGATSIYDQTLKLMMGSQKLRQKELDALKDKECCLLCFRCQKPVTVIDKENDKISKMPKEAAEKYIEDHH